MTGKKINACSVHSVIMADDDADDRMIFQEVVQEIAPSVKLNIVSDGQVLMSLLGNYIPDLLFMDLDMPYKNGLQCIKEIRENPALTDLPIVVLSSTNRPHNIVTAYEVGAHLVIQKTGSYQEMKDAFSSVLSLDWRKPELIKAQHIANGSFKVFTI
jgi:CheY-like chemotaxis protein